MRQALEMALEALERSVATCFDQRSHDEVMGRPEHFVNRAITAIKEALAQPEQEPVAWRWENKGEDKWLNKYIYLDNGAPDYPEECEPLYTTPQQRAWVDINTNQILDVYQEVLKEWRGGHQVNGQIAFARAIEAKIKEINE